MDALKYACELIEFESTSAVSNLPISDYLETTLQQMGFETERIEYDDPRGVRKANVVGKKGRGTGGFAYFGHTDVVPADDWFADEPGPFKPVVHENRLYGRGSCDMKGSIGCMLAAVADVPTEELTRPIYVTFTADEEVGYLGAAQVARRSSLFREMVSGQTHGIIGEPTQLDVVYAHKGAYAFAARSYGRAAHSSTREGVNANLAMIPFLVEMKQIHDETESDPAWQNSEFDPPTIRWNIGINDHTRAINITPPHSICTVYFRPMPGQDGDVLVERARRAAQACGLELEVSVAAPPLYVDPESHFIQEVMCLAGASVPRTVSYGTDGAKLTEMKNLALCGPGNIAQAHTSDEWIALEELERGMALYARFIRHWCC